MKHPSSADWMTLLYDEATVVQRAELEAHLAQCPVCASRVGAWRKTQGALDEWQVAAPARGPAATPRRWPWAAAAMLMLGVTFGLGRWSTATGPDSDRLREDLRAEFQQQLDATCAALRSEWERQADAFALAVQRETLTETQRLLTDYAQSSDERRLIDLQTLYAAMKQLEARRQQDQSFLRRELETVAVLTENSLAQLTGTH